MFLKQLTKSEFEQLQVKSRLVWQAACGRRNNECKQALAVCETHEMQQSVPQC